MVQLIEQPLSKPAADQRIVQTGRSWEQFVHIKQGFEQAPGVRLFYYEGTVEILMPGQLHETFSSIIGCLLMIFLAERQISFIPTGSMTQEKEGISSAQADESYCINGLKPIPDLAIEVVFTSGGVAKLRRYRALGVPEVWFWEDGLLSLHRLRAGGYEQVQRSELPGLEELDLILLRDCILMGETDAGEAIRRFQAGMRR